MDDKEFLEQRTTLACCGISTEGIDRFTRIFGKDAIANITTDMIVNYVKEYPKANLHRIGGSTIFLLRAYCGVI